MRSKLDFYIAFYEQLALKGFQAYKPSYDFEKKHIADICKDGYNIAHFTKAYTVEANPYAEVEAGTIDTLREILQSTIEMCNIIDARQHFSEFDLSIIHAGLVKMRVMPDNDFNFKETADIDSLIEKIENIVPELGGLAADFEYATERYAEQEAEQ